MEEFESNSEAGNRKWRSSNQVPTLGIGNGRVRAKFELGIGNGGVRAKFRRLESGMEEFEQSSRFGIGNGADRTKFQLLESGMEEFEPSSKLGIGNGGVRDKFEAWNRK